MRHLISIIIALAVICPYTMAQSRIVKDFTPVCDTLSERFADHCGVKSALKLKAVMKRGKTLDFYFTESLGDLPFYPGDIKWLRRQLKSLFPDSYSKYSLGEIYTRKLNVNKLELPGLNNDGHPVKNEYQITTPKSDRTIVSRIDTDQPSKGLSGRHIALWQSHGRYFDQSADRWQWQRPCLFQTCEDMFTQGFVLPYLVPMLENAGAYILMPRERDTQRNEVITDNDPSCGARGYGEYEETGKWQNAGYGFADTTEFYLDLENPFTAGTARQALCVGPKSQATSSIRWTPEIPERGEYAVYISYKTLTNSTSAAHYTVRHLGGESEFIVNQKMGGGTWVYLGTFEFEKGSDGHVSLDNRLIEGYSYEVGTVVTADAVRFGGGMGNIARYVMPSPEDTTSTDLPEPSVSGLPRFAEGARYWLQWAGADTTIYYQNKGQHDYRDDFMSRGDWVEWISRGSRVNPMAEGGLGIPVDLSFGFHTDAGVTPDDSIVGTLAIYTYKSDGKNKLPAGEDRLTSRMYADIIQSQIVNDIRADFDSLWTRRCLWDRGYRESRTPSCPSMLLELLSHQNFADMKYGLDPSFRFTVSRAIYKGMLKYLSNRYGCDYVVQPLPVSDMAVQFGKNGKAVISWKGVEDPLEPTASPCGYIIYRRIGDGAFDEGTIVRASDTGDGYIRAEMDMPDGEVASFKVVAFNDGGISFPSEIMSIGRPATGQSRGDEKVLIVNNFDRVSGPSSFDGVHRAGFENRHDSGVPYVKDITFVGEMYDFKRSNEWKSNDDPGFGASHSDMAGEIIAGNTFDFASIHGKAILDAGFAFYSCSNERFASDSVIISQAWSLDLICGKQETTVIGANTKYQIFTEDIQKAISRFAQNGGNLIISGANIASDAGSDKKQTEFISNTFGYKLASANATRSGQIKPYKAGSKAHPVKLVMHPNSQIYCVESPDGLKPSAKSGKTIYRYADSGISAAVAHQGNGYKAVSFGFPLESLESYEMTNDMMINILEYLKQ